MRALNALSAAASLHAPPAALFELSNLLDTGLDRETLAILVELCESGVNPEALSKVVVELRRESEVMRASQAAE